MENLKIIADKLGEKNEELEQGANELYSELMKIKNMIGQLTDSTIINSSDLQEKYFLELEDEEEMNID